MRHLFSVVPIALIAVLGWLVSPAGAEDEDSPEAAVPELIPRGAFLNEVGETRQERFENLDVSIDHGDGEALVLTFHNRGAEPCEVSLVATLSQQSSIPLGRMGPMQVQLEQEHLLVRLGPGERMERRLSTTPPAPPEGMVALNIDIPMDMYVVTLTRPAAERASFAMLRIAAPPPDGAPTQSAEAGGTAAK